MDSKSESMLIIMESNRECPMSELRQFIHQRRQTLIHQLRQIEAELNELDRAEDALSYSHESPRHQEELQLHAELDVDPEELTIQQMALYTLAVRRAGGTANEILGYIEHDFGRTLERTSLSPQLSRLRKAGKVLFVDGGYYITPHGDEYIRGVMDTGGE